MAFNVNTFRSQFSNKEPVRTNLFEVVIYNRLTDPERNETELPDFTKFLCLATDLPGVQFDSQTIQHFGYGVAERRPTNSLFEDITMHFIVDSDALPIQYFTAWYNMINDFSGAPSTTHFSRNHHPGEVEYRNNYVATIEILVYQTSGDLAFKYQLDEGFPIAIGTTKLAWSDQNEILVLPVRMNYRRWRLLYVANSSTTIPKSI